MFAADVTGGSYVALSNAAETSVAAPQLFPSNNILQV